MSVGGRSQVGAFGTSAEGATGVSCRWAVFLSGRGSTAQALFDVIDQIDVRWVVSSRASALGLKRAARCGLPTTVLASPIDWQGLDQELQQRRIEKIFLLGFMRLLPAEFVRSWRGRIWNVHPSLLPAFPGAHAMEKSFQAGAPMGVTIHDVNEEMDAGVRRRQAQAQPCVAWEEMQLRMAISEQRLIRDWAAAVNFRGWRSEWC
ncbi:MAG: hypothetical protein C5B49_08615 [Bdellovibrio sp.]|nr:MAG: hypothetical protein C5B49_08615 [Bdellovibrio sp.]